MSDETITGAEAEASECREFVLLSKAELRELFKRVLDKYDALALCGSDYRTVRVRTVDEMIAAVEAEYEFD